MAVADGDSELMGDMVQAILVFYVLAVCAVRDRRGLAGPAAVHEQALDTFDRAVEMRRLRQGGGLAIAASFFFKVGDRRLHAVMVGLLATFIAMVVVLITAFDQPFAGDLGIEPDAFRLILSAMTGS